MKYLWFYSIVLMLLPFALLLGGCNTIAPTYSDAAYEELSEAAYSAQDMSLDCGAVTAASIHEQITAKVGLAREQAKMLPATKEIVDADDNLLSIISGLESAYKGDAPVSPVYCQDKLANIQAGADKILAIYGGLK